MIPPKTPIRTQAKRRLQAVLPTTLPPIIIASMGRSGSTLVWDAVRNAVTENRFPPPFRGPGSRVVSETMWRLSEAGFQNGVVYKTHALADELSHPGNARVIFLFGSASAAALSVYACRDRYGEAWIKQHFDHLRASGPFEQLAERDVLRFGDQLDGWIGKSGVPRLIINYEKLWDNQEALSNFVGIPVDLPTRRERLGPKSVNSEIRARFSETYKQLDARIASMPAVQELY